MRAWMLLILTFIQLSGYAMMNQKKIIYGYVEKATLIDNNLVLSAKLDTGAKSASLSAIHITEVEKNGKTYLTFTVPSKKGDVVFTSEYVGKVSIKLRAEEHGIVKRDRIKRPVVLMRIRLGHLERVIPVNLTNRKRFLYPLLLGREAIKAFDGLVDPSAAFITKNETAVSK